MLDGGALGGDANQEDGEVDESFVHAQSRQAYSSRVTIRATIWKIRFALDFFYRMACRSTDRCT